MHKIAVFASGSGSNAQKIIEYFQHHAQAEVGLVLTNNPRAGVLERAANFGVPSYIFNRSTFYTTDEVVEELKSHQITFVVLAGFLWLTPANLVQAYPHRIINIHPALLPKFGGKGMYGRYVHEAVVHAGERESGITIHYVNEHYDEGQIIFQATCALDEKDTADTVAHKVQILEHQHFPEVIAKLLAQLPLTW